MADQRTVLTIRSLVSGYGKRQVLNGVSVEARLGEIVALIGHNGAGKSTVLKAAFGLLPVWSGGVRIEGVEPKNHFPASLVPSGVAYVPQGNRIFGELSVRDNLEMLAGLVGGGRQLREQVNHAIAIFPALEPLLGRRAGTLSGGEKQVLALANALVCSPRLLLLDEPSLGLAPPLVTETLRRVAEIREKSATTIVIVEQKVREVLKIADRVYVLRNGCVSYCGSSASLEDDSKLREVYL